MSGGRRAARAGHTARVTLSPAARAWRLVVGALVIGLVTAGTLVGDDRWWPFAPMSQYAFLVETDGGVVDSTYLEATTVDGEDVPVRLDREHLGLERSEIEGQLGSIVRDPGLLQAVAVLHARRQPSEPRWAQVRVMTDRTVLGDRPSHEVLVRARWDVRHAEDPERGL